MFRARAADKPGAMLRLNPRAAVCRFVIGLLTVVAAPGCRLAGHDDAVKTLTVYDMLAAFPRAELHKEGPGQASKATFDVGGDVLPGVFLHPTSTLQFPSVHVTADSVLTFKIGVMQTAWDQPGDGVEFDVFVQRANDAQQKVFSKYLDPKHNENERHWFEERVPLGDAGDQDVRITLATDAGPAKDFTADWAIWAEPQVILTSN
jgi:hypothetical protein